MSLNGLGVVAIWHDLLPAAKDEFYQWHNREHMPERVGIPGFQRGRRYIALERQAPGTPEFFNLYEADSIGVLGGADYLARLDDPTPWTRRVVASFRNVARSICRVLYSAGVGQGGIMLTLRFDLGEAHERDATHRLCLQVLPPLAELTGIAGVHLCCADEATSRIETAEKKARSDGTEVPRWVLLIEGGSRDAVEAVAGLAQTRLTDLGATNLRAATYRFEHQRGKLPAGDR